MLSAYNRGDVRGALNQWNNNVSWKWTPEYRRFWNNMRRFDRHVTWHVQGLLRDYVSFFAGLRLI